METLVSVWSTGQSLPETYIFPPDKRPGKLVVPLCKTIPVEDLGKAAGHDRDDIIQEILKACPEFGFFQVINHGVSGNSIDDAMSVVKELFGMSDEDKASLYSEDPNRSCRLYTSSANYDHEEVHCWRDTLRHPCHPLELYMQDLIGRYSVEVRKLALRIFDLICEGLGLELGYFGDKLSKDQLLSANHHPPCPDPSLTLVLPKHCDPNLITILHQGDVYRLQVFKDGEWIGVQPLPNAFVVNIGFQLQIISNGKLKSAEHRVVTNSSSARTTIATFIYPSCDFLVEPAKALVNECNPPLYGAFRYREFLSTYIAKEGDTETVLKPYKFQA